MNNTAWKPESNPSAALRTIIAALQNGGIASASAEARLILASLIDQPLILAPPLTEAQQARISDIVARRLTGTPLQHLLGEMTFCHLQLTSDRRALVVRPETELLATWAIRALGKYPAGERVVIDIGTGSGNLALAIATAVPGAQVTAIDVSASALGLAAENIARHREALAQAGSTIELVEGDVRTFSTRLRARLVVANPPYLPGGETVPAEVGCDPQLALYGGGAAGLELPEACVSFAAGSLHAGGLLLLEHHHTQGAALRDYARSCGFGEAQTRLDLPGRQRFLQARMC